MDELSLSFADRLFRDFGDWEECAELLTDDKGSPTGAFRLSVPQPHGERSLDVRTDEGEITVSFGFWHEHFGSFLGISDQEAIALALEEIHSILEERGAVRVSFKGGAWSGSSVEDANETLAPSREGETAVAYSWLGTHDRNL
ncbi:MAG TPA: hypothetical protein VGF49_01345 [Candidatus Solibacter sp.]